MIRHLPASTSSIAQGDAGSFYALAFTGLPFDPTAFAATFAMVNAHTLEQLFSASAEISDVLAVGSEWGCTLRHEWTAEETSEPGLYQARFTLTGGDVVLTLPAIVSHLVQVIPVIALP